jgi:hypothetical protein
MQISGIDSDTLKQGAIAYQTYSHLFDALVVAAYLGIISTIRYFVGKKNVNLHPSGWWYVPKVVGMLWTGLTSLSLVHGGFAVIGLGGNPIVLVVLGGAALAELYWAYRIIWRPIYVAKGMAGMQ